MIRPCARRRRCFRPAVSALEGRYLLTWSLTGVSASPSTAPVSDPVDLEAEGTDLTWATYNWYIWDQNGNLVDGQGNGGTGYLVDTSPLTAGLYTAEAYGTYWDYGSNTQTTGIATTTFTVQADQITGLGADNSNPVRGDVVTFSPTYNVPQITAPGDSLTWQSLQYNVPGATWAPLQGVDQAGTSYRWPATLPVGTYDIRATLLSAGVTTTQDVDLSIAPLPMTTQSVTYVDFRDPTVGGGTGQDWMDGVVQVTYPNSGVSKVDPDDHSVSYSTITVQLWAAPGTIASQIEDISQYGLSLIVRTPSQPWTYEATNTRFPTMPDPLNDVYTVSFTMLAPVTADTKFQIVAEQPAGNDLWRSDLYPNLPSPSHGTIWKINGHIYGTQTATDDYYPGSNQWGGTAAAITKVDQATGIGGPNAYIPTRILDLT